MTPAFLNSRSAPMICGSCGFHSFPTRPSPRSLEKEDFRESCPFPFAQGEEGGALGALPRLLYCILPGINEAPLLAFLHCRIRQTTLEVPAYRPSFFPPLRLPCSFLTRERIPSGEDLPFEFESMACTLKAFLFLLSLLFNLPLE